MKNLKKAEFLEGIKDSFPFGVAFIFLYLSIGALGKAHSLSFFETISTTIFVFSTPLQYLLVQNYSEGWVLAPLILAMNARFFLMSAYLAPYFREQKMWKIIFSLIIIVPSVFAACKEKFSQKKNAYFVYFLGIGTPIYLGSVLCTSLGYEIGSYISNNKILAVVLMILPIQFTCLAGKHWPNLYDTLCYWGGFIAFPLMAHYLKIYDLLVTPFIVGGIAVFAEKRRD